ncbi:hypothetical protein ACTHAM_002781 [Cellulomonas soli]|uniref:hypothetical protein n=1 Tax=Cellulomonas soli TaxID=931535 RepID=UPI003F865E16
MSEGAASLSGVTADLLVSTRDVPARLPAVDPVSAETPRADARRRARGVLLGLLTATAIAALRTAGILEGWWGLGLCSLLVLAVPSSRLLSRRILLNATITLGWLPLLWWVRLPVDPLGRVTLLMAITTGVLVGWVGGGPSIRARSRRLVPQVALADLGPLLAGLGTAAIVTPWWRLREGASALGALALGWDHSAHYAMTHMIRVHGVLTSTLGPAPDGQHWSYASYPQGTHAVLAALVETQRGSAVGPVREELVAYAHGLGFLAVVVCILAAAAVCSIPGARRRPLVLPLSLVPVTVLALGPGARLLLDGFPNLMVAIGFLAVLPALVVLLERVHLPVVLLSLGAAVVGVAHSWALLLPVAGAFAVPALLPWARRRWHGSRARLWSTGVIAAVTAGATARALMLLAGTDLGRQLTLGGGVNAPSLRQVVAICGAAVLAPVVLWVLKARGRLTSGAGSVTRGVALLAVALVGAGGALALAWWQTRSTGALSYYFWKYAIAASVTASSVVAVCVVLAVVARPNRTRAPRLAWPAASVAALVVTQAFGFAAPAHIPAPFTPLSPAMPARGALSVGSVDPSAAAQRLVEAARVPAPPLVAGHAVLLSDPDAPGLFAAQAGQWYLALTGAWTDGANPSLGLLGLTTQEPASMAVTILGADPDAVVVVDPAHVEQVRAAAGPMANRVYTW